MVQSQRSIGRICVAPIREQLRTIVSCRSFSDVCFCLKVLAVSLFDRLFIATVSVLSVHAVRMVCRVTVRGREHIKRRGQTLYLIRHRSALGIFLIQCLIMWPWVLWTMRMWPLNVAKEQHLKRLFPWALWYIRHINIMPLPDEGHSEHRRQILGDLVAEMKACPDRMAILYPEGRRAKLHECQLLPFKSGAASLIAQTRPLLVFVWDDDSYQLLSPTLRCITLGRMRIPCGLRRSSVAVTISRPIDTSDPSTGVSRICQQFGNDDATLRHELTRHLHNLFRLWAERQCGLAGTGTTDNPMVEEDYSRLI